MGIGYLKKSVIKNSIIGALLFVILGAAIGYMGYYNREYIQSIFGEPLVLTEDAKNPNFFTSMFAPIANVDKLSIQNTGYYLWEQADNGPEKKTDGIFLTYAEDKYVICVYPSTVAEDPDQLDTKDMIAYVDDTSSVEKYEELHGKLLADLNEAFKDQGVQLTSDDFAPKVLYIVSKDTLVVRQIILAVIGLLGVFMIICFIKNLLALINYKSAKGIKHLEQYGPIEQVIDEIEGQQPYYNEKGQLFTNEWFISTKLSTSVIKIEDIIWVYTEMMGYRNLSICTLQVCTKNGKKYHIYTVSEKNHIKVSNQINEILPWIYYGNTKENHALWKSNIQGMLNEIEVNKKFARLNENSVD